MSVSVCVFVCPWSYLRNYTSDLHQFLCMLLMAVARSLLWRRSDMLHISGFVDDVIFAHQLIGCSTSPPGWGSEAYTYVAVGLARRNTRCRQPTLGTTADNCTGGNTGGGVCGLWLLCCFVSLAQQAQRYHQNVQQGVSVWSRHLSEVRGFVLYYTYTHMR